MLETTNVQNDSHQKVSTFHPTDLKTLSASFGLKLGGSFAGQEEAPPPACHMSTGGQPLHNDLRATALLQGLGTSTLDKEGNSQTLFIFTEVKLTFLIKIYSSWRISS
jgi:hypothetical protein